MKKRFSPSDPGLTLAVDAAEGFLQLALADAEGNFLLGQSIHAPSRGAEILAPSIRHALALLERRPGDIRNIAAVAGPGGFTGLRLTAATAAGLARAVGAKQAPLDYMDLLARQVFSGQVFSGQVFSGQCLSPASRPGVKKLLFCLTRARRDLVYAQGFALDSENTPARRAVTNLTVLSVASGDLGRHILEAAAREKAALILLAGTGAHENRETLAAHLPTAGEPEILFTDITRPAPDTLLAAALEAEYAGKDIEPLYVRASDAEENLPHIAARLGLDPDGAVAKLHALTHSIPVDIGD